MSQEDSRNDGILNQFSERVTISGVNELTIIQTDMITFSSGQMGLKEMQIHFITIEIGIVRFTISIMHSNCLFSRKDSSYMTHQRGFVQSRLSVEKEYITRL